MMPLAKRKHLLQSLDPEQLAPLIIISAPAGCGKTVLAQQIINHLGYPSIWHQMDTWQRDASSLHEMSRHVWHRDKPNLIIPDYGDSASSAAHKLIEAIRPSLDQPTCYVLEDLHHIYESEQAEQWLQSILDHCPSNLHIILVGRKLPILNWYQVIGRGQIHAYNKNDLQMHAEDVQAISELSQSEAEALVKQYNGWAAAIRLALDSRLNLIARSTLQSDLPSDALFEQLISHFFQEQSQAEQQLLLIASLTKHLSLQMVGDLFEAGTLLSYLEQLLQEHLFVTKTGQGYELHDLFRSFLQNHLQKIHPDRYHYLHLKVAQWYEQEDENEEAISHYLKADAKPQAIRLAEIIASELHIRGLWQSLLTINDLLKDEAAPRTQLFSSMVLLEQHKIDQSDEQLARATATFEERGDQDNLIRARLLKTHNYQRRRQHHTALNEAKDILEEKDLVPMSQAWAYRVIGLSQIELGQYEAAIEALQQSIEILLAENERGYSYSQILQDLSVAYMRSGQFEAGIAKLQDVLAWSRSSDNAIRQALALNNLGCAFQDASQYKEAIHSLEGAKALLSDHDTRAAMIIFHSLGDLYRDLGDFITAHHSYDRAYHIAQQHYDDNFIVRIILSRCRIALWNNDPHEGAAYLAQSNVPPIIKTVEDRLLHTWREIFLLLEKPLAHSADSLLHHIEELSQQHAVKVLSTVLASMAYLGLLYQIPILIDTFQTLSGQVLLCFPQALALDSYHLPTVRNLFQKEDEIWQDLAPSYEALREQAKKKDDVKSQLPQQLEIKMLGQNQLILEGQSLSETNWATPKARAFFYCLFFHGKLNKAQLSRYLWQNHSSYRARNALRDVRKRIKSILPDLVIFEDNEYQLNPDWHIVSDLTVFQYSLLQAKQLPYRDARTETLYLRALALYGEGGLLPDLYEHFLIPLREKYEKLYLDAIQGSAHCARARGDYSAAIQHYEHFLSISPYEESIYRDIMTCFANNLQMVQVQLTYNRLRECLLSELDLEPHLQTQALLHQLLT